MEAAYEMGLSSAGLHRQPYHHTWPLPPPYSCAAGDGTDADGATPRRHDDEIDRCKASRVDERSYRGRQYD